MSHWRPLGECAFRGRKGGSFRKMASHWRLPGESASGKVFLRQHVLCPRCECLLRQKGRCIQKNGIPFVTAWRGCLWESFSGGGRQGRQRLVRRPIGDSPLESASSGKVFLLVAHSTALQCLPWKSFSSGGGRQGRQRVVRHPVGDSPLESASIGRQSGPFTIEAGRAGSPQYPVTVPLFLLWVAGKAGSMQYSFPLATPPLQCLLWKSFSSSGDRQVRQSVVRSPVGISRKNFFSGRQAGQAACSNASR